MSEALMPDAIVCPLAPSHKSFRTLQMDVGRKNLADRQSLNEVVIIRRSAALAKSRLLLDLGASRRLINGRYSLSSRVGSKK